MDGNPTTNVTYTLEPQLGTISLAGVYAPPEPIPSRQTVKITATSNANPGLTASVEITLIPVSLSIEPAGPLSVTPGQTVTFVPTISGAPDTTVNWTVSPASGAGTMNGNTYMAPTGISNSVDAELTATSAADPARSQVITIKVNASNALSFASNSVSVGPNANSGTIAVSAYPSTLEWKVSSNQEWLTVDPASRTGSQNVTYSYRKNDTLAWRSAVLTVTSTELSPPRSHPPSPCNKSRPRFRLNSIRQQGDTEVAGKMM